MTFTSRFGNMQVQDEPFYKSEGGQPNGVATLDGSGKVDNTQTFNNTIQDESISLPQRPTIAFIGADVTASDDPINNRTIVTITAPSLVLAVVKKNADATLTNYTTNWATGGASGITLTLPPASANAYINIIKVDNNAGWVTIEGDGAETINGEPNFVLQRQYESISLSSDGTEWIIY